LASDTLHNKKKTNREKKREEIEIRREGEFAPFRQTLTSIRKTDTDSRTTKVAKHRGADVSGEQRLMRSAKGRGNHNQTETKETTLRKKKKDEAKSTGLLSEHPFREGIRIKTEVDGTVEVRF